jgi:hypothetical protein
VTRQPWPRLNSAEKGAHGAPQFLDRVPGRFSGREAGRAPDANGPCRNPGCQVLLSLDRSQARQRLNPLINCPFKLLENTLAIAGANMAALPQRIGE